VRHVLYYMVSQWVNTAFGWPLMPMCLAHLKTLYGKDKITCFLIFDKMSNIQLYWRLWGPWKPWQDKYYCKSCPGFHTSWQASGSLLLDSWSTKDELLGRDSWCLLKCRTGSYHHARLGYQQCQVLETTGCFWKSTFLQVSWSRNCSIVWSSSSP